MQNYRLHSERCALFLSLQENIFGMKKSVRFALVVCVFSWLAFFVFYACSGFEIKSSLSFNLFATVYMFFPLLTAVVLQKINREPLRSTGLLKFKPGWTWATAIVLPLLICLLVTLVSALMPGVHFHYGAEQILSMQSGLNETSAAVMQAQLANLPPTVMILSTLVSAVFAGCTINAVAAFGEEYGWRNYLASALRGKSFMKSALFIGIVWGIWHFPLILCGHNYHQHPGIGVPMMVIFCILLGIIELYLVKKAGSVYPAAIFHGTINASGGTTLFFVNGGNDLTIGVTGLAGFISLGIIIILLWAYDRHVSRDLIFSSPL